jgi:hypothetical protein
MPASANSSRGKVSVCSRRRRVASASPPDPGGSTARPVEPPLGEEREAEQREHQQQPPREHAGSVDRHRALGHGGAAADDVAVDAVERHVHADGVEECGEQAQAGQHRLRGEPGAPRPERLHEHGDHGDPRDDEQRGQQRPLDRGRGDVGPVGQQQRRHQ